MRFLAEKTPPPLRRNIGGDAGQVEALTRAVHGVAVNVSGEDLQGQMGARLQLFQRLLEDDGQRVGFLARGAAGDPRAQSAAVLPAREQRRQEFIAQLRPRRRFAEEAGHADEQLLEQQITLLRIFAQIPDVMAELADLMQAHPPLDAAVKGVALVKREVVAGLAAQQEEDFFELAGRGRIRLDRRGAGEQRGVPQILQQARGQLLRRGHDVRQPGINGAAGHAVELRRVGLLHQHHAGLLLDGLEAQRAVAAHAGKDHAHAALPLIFSERPQKEINGQPQAARRGRVQQMQHAVQDGQVLVRRDDIDAVRADGHAVLHLEDFHLRHALEQFGHDALVRGIEVLDDDERHAARRRHIFQKMFKGLQSAGRRAEADDGECASGGGNRIVRKFGRLWLFRRAQGFG